MNLSKFTNNSSQKEFQVNLIVAFNLFSIFF